MKDIRVVFAFAEDVAFGSALAAVELVKNLKQNEKVIPIVLTCQDSDLNRQMDDLYIENYVVGHRPFMFCGNPATLKYYAAYFPRWIRNIVATKKAVRRTESAVDLSTVDLIYTNTLTIDLGAILAQKYQLPHVWHVREYGNFGFHSYRGDPFALVQKSADAVIAISEALAQYCVEHNIEEKKVTAIYDGVDFEKICTKKKGEGNTFRIVMAGTLAREKGYITAIKAISALPKELKKKVRLDIFGSGTSTEIREIHEAIQCEHLEKQIMLKGYNRQLAQELSNYEVGIVASKSEGFGRCTVEYIAAGLWVLGSNTGATPEVLKMTEGGWLFPYEDAHALAGLLQRGYLEKPEQNAAYKVRELFSAKENAHQIRNVFDRTVKLNAE